MLQRSIITKLRNKEVVEGELFDSATILFSDIPMFAALAGDYPPIVLVEFLNLVYSTFDETIAKFEAYKVETINDCYLVCVIAKKCFSNPYMNNKVQNLLYCLAVFGHFLDPPGNHSRGAIFPTVD